MVSVTKRTGISYRWEAQGETPARRHGICDLVDCLQSEAKRLHGGMVSVAPGTCVTKKYM